MNKITSKIDLGEAAKKLQSHIQKEETARMEQQYRDRGYSPWMAKSLAAEKIRSHSAQKRDRTN